MKPLFWWSSWVPGWSLQNCFNIDCLWSHLKMVEVETLMMDPPLLNVLSFTVWYAAGIIIIIILNNWFIYESQNKMKCLYQWKMISKYYNVKKKGRQLWDTLILIVPLNAHMIYVSLIDTYRRLVRLYLKLTDIICVIYDTVQMILKDDLPTIHIFFLV